MIIKDVEPSTRCEDCGEDLPADARFCNRCGARVGPADGGAVVQRETLGGATDLIVTPPTPGVIRPLYEAAPAFASLGTQVGRFASEMSPTNVIIGKLVGLLVVQGIAVAVVLRALAGGFLQQALDMVVQRISVALFSSSLFNQLGVLAQPVRSLVGQIVNGVEGRSFGYPSLPDLIVSTTLGLILLAALPAGFVIAAEPAQRWQPLLRRIRPGVVADQGVTAEPLAPWSELAMAATEASRVWLRTTLPYVGVAFVLALLGLVPALFGLLCWLLAGVLALEAHIPAERTRLRLALPGIYALAALLMFAIAGQGLRAWGG
jgi:hypothetical protein